MRGPPVWAAGAESDWAAGAARAGADEAEETGAVEAGCGAVVARDFRGLTVTVSLKPIWAKTVLSGW